LWLCRKFKNAPLSNTGGGSDVPSSWVVFQYSEPVRYTTRPDGSAKYRGFTLLTRNGPEARAGLTVIVGVVALGAVSLVAVTVAVPTATAVNVMVAPLDELTELAALTANIVGSLETQFTVRPLRMLPLPSLG
jgi:hypothetical protein